MVMARILGGKVLVRQQTKHWYFVRVLKSGADGSRRDVEQCLTVHRYDSVLTGLLKRLLNLCSPVM